MERITWRGFSLPLLPPRLTNFVGRVQPRVGTDTSTALRIEIQGFIIITITFISINIDYYLIVSGIEPGLTIYLLLYTVFGVEFTTVFRANQNSNF